MGSLGWGEESIGGLKVSLWRLLKVLLLSQGRVKRLLTLDLGHLHPSLFFPHSLVQLSEGVGRGELGMLLAEGAYSCHWCKNLRELDSLISNIP